MVSSAAPFRCTRTVPLLVHSHSTSPTHIAPFDGTRTTPFWCTRTTPFWCTRAAYDCADAIASDVLSRGGLHPIWLGCRPAPSCPPNPWFWQAAQLLGVAIHTVYIGSSRDDAYPEQLARLAALTGGVCYQAVIDGAGTLELHDRSHDRIVATR
eukprot:4726814-Prymnesium_polylepis.2